MKCPNCDEEMLAVEDPLTGVDLCICTECGYEESRP